MRYEQPHPYQEKFIQSFFDAIADGERRMLGVLPTGTGKTVCFVEIAKRLNVPTLILAHRDELIEQAVTKLREVWTDAPVGVIKGKRNETGYQVTVASVQSLHRRRLDSLPTYGLIVTDEAHHAAAPSYRRIYHRYGLLDESPDKKNPLKPLDCETLHLGVTATPKRSDNKGLKAIFDKIIFEAKLFDFVPRYLADLKIRGVDTSLDLSRIRVSQLTRDFDEAQLGKVMMDDELTSGIFRAYQDLAHERRRTLVFCVNREHAHWLYEYFSDRGVSCGYADYKTPPDERKQTLDDFRRGELNALFNVMLFTEGFDLPAIDCILIARPTKSPLLLTQMIGRGTRTAEGKEDCMIIDTALWQRGTDAVSVASLFNINPEELKHDKPVSEILAAHASEQGASDTDEDSPEYALQLILDSVFAIRDKFQSSLWWHNHRASAKQMNVINRQLTAVGEEPVTGISKGQAAAMIGAIFNAVPATTRQIWKLRQLGVAHDAGITKNNASELIDKAINQ